MQYFYRLEPQGKWIGPYAEGRVCIFDAAWAAQLGNAQAEATAVPNGMHPDEALAVARAIPARVPNETLIGNINHIIYEPPSEWIMADDDDSVPSEMSVYGPRPARDPSRRVRGISVRPASSDDIAAMLEVQRRAFAAYLDVFAPHQIHMLHETIEDVQRAINGMSVYVAVENGVVRGSARVRVRHGVGMVTNIAVDPEHERRGIGTAMLQVIEDHVRGAAHKLYLETPLLAPQSLRFYVDLGYGPAGILRRHYGGMDWLAFEKFVA